LKSKNSPYKAKDELLDAYENKNLKEENLSYKELFIVYGFILLAFLILLPKIYIANNIYYDSKDINKLYHKYTALKEENEALKKNLEKVRFRDEVLDAIR
jgi:hypothetical protein